MIHGIIFSKDRACQLKLTLESIKKNAHNLITEGILDVIYLASDEEFQKGYDKLIEEFDVKSVNFIKQTNNFKEDVLLLLKKDSDYTVFFTDDDIIFNPISTADIISNLKLDEDIFCFSLRLGQNIKWCYTMECDNNLINFEDCGNFIKWDWTLHYLDFGYPLSVDGHVFRTNDIFKLIRKTNFTNPNTLEAGLQMFDNFPRNKMVSYKTSALVNSPTNMVQKSFQNVNGTKYGITAKDLNDKFLSGETIDFSSLDFSDIKGCHQELELKFEINEQ
jgi:hypothetical protein